MKIGIVRELKTGETRVGLTPESVRRRIAAGAGVVVERGAGARAGFDDESYRSAGAILRDTAAEVWAGVDLIVKVKEPQPAEFASFRPGLGLFCYLHLAAAPTLAAALRERGVVACAFEDVRGRDGSLPLLKPMSHIAGRLAPQVGARFLETAEGGPGILLGGAPGVPGARVTVVGAGASGGEACRVAVGLGARVAVLDRDVAKLEALGREFGARVATFAATAGNIAASVAAADLVIGAVLVPGARAPVVIDRAMVRTMAPGRVIVDISIDQGGCVEGIRPTSLREPVYREDGVTFYAAPNMPALAGRTATLALGAAIEPWVDLFVRAGLEGAFAADAGLAAGRVSAE